MNSYCLNISVRNFNAEVGEDTDLGGDGLIVMVVSATTMSVLELTGSMMKISQFWDIGLNYNIYIFSLKVGVFTDQYQKKQTTA